MDINFKDLLDNILDGLYFVDRDRRITYWNKAAETITGFKAEEVIGSRCADNILIHVDDDGNCLCSGKCPLAGMLGDGIPRDDRVYLHHKTGHRVPVWIRITPLRDSSGRIIGGAELFSDISCHHEVQSRIQELESMALLDPLTALPNRYFIESELDARFHEMARYNLAFGVLFMDIDRFKQFNDVYGHAIGDQVLKAVASTLKSAARPYDTIGRWGGEEFLAIIRNVSPDCLTRVGERFRMLVEKTTIPIRSLQTGVTLSIGATMARSDDTQASVIRRADELMYRSKRNGRNRIESDRSDRTVIPVQRSHMHAKG